MKNNTWTIFKKECARFFGDRTMLMTTVIMPGLLIYIIYSFMGDNFMQPKDDGKATSVYVDNMPESLSPAIGVMPFNLVTDGFDGETLKSDLSLKDSDFAYMVFPEGFDSLVANYNPASGLPAPNVLIYHNSASEKSRMAYDLLCGVLNQWEDSMTNRFDINASSDAGEVFDLAKDEDIVGDLFSELIPMLLLLMAFSGCMSIAPPSIAGEKERGTIATLLVTPLKRNELALGKVLSLSLFALLSGMSSFLGMMLSLPKLIHADEMGLSANIYTFSDYGMLLLLILCTVLVLTAVSSIISAKAKSVKAAQSVMAPLMLVVMLVGMMPMMTGSEVSNNAVFLIPIYNSVQSMSMVFAHEAALVPVVITVAANIVYAVLGVWVLTKLLNSEKVMFSK
ncbi:MAG: ABC transporter permease subunit [Bacteroidales bacterium]|nr:ABC transporter permease subunit [Bacteroidales bacterium]